MSLGRSCGGINICRVRRMHGESCGDVGTPELIIAPRLIILVGGFIDMLRAMLNYLSSLAVCFGSCACGYLWSLV